ncbi:MAG: GLUG motif-containing protein, partial [Sedimentisphaerales bacterium]
MGRMFFAAIIIGGLMLSSICLGYSGGSGTAEDPYQIADANDLLALAADTSNYDKCFILTADVNLQGQVFTTAIIAADTNSKSGFQGTAFAGTFDGNNHNITNFTINGGRNWYLGLFGYIDAGGLVKNLGFENFSVSGDVYVGGLVGWNTGGISNCYSTGSVSGTWAAVGGLVGWNTGGISDCYSTGDVNLGHGYSGYGLDVGGLVGYVNGGSVSNCYATGTVSSLSGSYSFDVGGLVGCVNGGGSISQCYATGAVNSYDSSRVGGLVGWNTGGISQCYSTGAVNGYDGSSRVGGLVGENNGSISIISNCYSTGTVSGYSDVGGLVGSSWWCIVSNCYSTGTVSGSSSVGGLVGGNGGSSISNCYST